MSVVNTFSSAYDPRVKNEKIVWGEKIRTCNAVHTAGRLFGDIPTAWSAAIAYQGELTSAEQERSELPSSRNWEKEK